MHIPFSFHFHLLLLFSLISNNVFSQAIQKHEFQYQKMGTTFRIIFYHPSHQLPQNIEDQINKKIDHLNSVFSDYDADSEISQLSKTAGTDQKVKVSKELWQVLRQAQCYARKSDGAFDITIGPLSKLWRSMFRRSEIFDGVKINAAKSLVGYQNLQLFPFSKRVKLKVKGMRLDAGGIAKGYTVDAIAKILLDSDIDQFLVDGGGDLYLGNPPPDKMGWTVKISVEDQNDQSITQKLVLSNTAVASSGDTYRFLEWEGKRYSHIIDPRTGYGVIDRKIINVQAPTCMQADAIASTLSVLSVDEQAAFLKKFKKVKVF
ncbi:MAG: FAD:protein FMN transferase [Bacteroidota bacterium]